MTREYNTRNVIQSFFAMFGIIAAVQLRTQVFWCVPLCRCVQWFSTFRRNVMPSSSGSKLQDESFCHVPSKRREPLTQRQIAVTPCRERPSRSGLCYCRSRGTDKNINCWVQICLHVHVNSKYELFNDTLSVDNITQRR